MGLGGSWEWRAVGLGVLERRGLGHIVKWGKKELSSSVLCPHFFVKRKLHVYLFALCTEKSGMVYSAFTMVTSKESGVAESMNRNFLLFIFFFLECLFFPIGIVFIL